MKYFVLIVSLLSAAVFPGKAATPNIIIIYTDDQGSVDAGCYGSADIETPHIDYLAENGVRFTQMLAPSAICSASRAGLMTGKIPPRAGVPGNVSSAHGNAGMPTSEFTMAELLKTKGYRTGHVGKWHIGYTPETMPNGQGFDSSFGHMGGCIDNYSHFFYWNGPNRHDLWRDGKEIWRDGEYFGDLMVDEMKRLITEKSEDPFFIYWAINWPHYPLQGTSKWREKYKDLPHPRDKYATFVSTTDELVGNIIGQLKEAGKLEDTLILFQSDHGHSVEERTFGGGGSAGPYRGHKGVLLEGGLRVPSVVSWPAKFPKGEVREQMVSGTDWYPTFAEITGATIPESHVVDGKSILEVIQDRKAETPHPDFYWRLGGDPNKGKWAVREGEWKLLGNVSENVKPDGLADFSKTDRQLFLANLKDDIGETKNVAEANKEVVERLLNLKAKYEKSFQESKESGGK